MFKNQSEMLKAYTDSNREPFNPMLLHRSNEDNIEAIMSIIRSCQRSKFYTIQVNNYYTIEEPIKIHQKLHDYEQTIINNSKNADERENEWDFIHIRDSAIILLVVNYTIAINGVSEELEVLIMVPRYVNKFYFRIQGNFYIPLYQIVDGSTYNNTGSSNRKVDIVTNKTLIAAPFKISKYQYTAKTIDDIEVLANVFVTNIFGKNTSIFKFILTKHGLLETLSLSGLNGVINITETPPEDKENLYIFSANDFYISTPKLIFDSDDVVQSLLYTILTSVIKNITLHDLFTQSFWLCSGGSEISGFSEEQGERLIESIENVYDEITLGVLNISEYNKQDVYHIMLWMIKNFTPLMQKDNLNVRIKRLKISEYIASYYGMKLMDGIHRISKLGKRAKVSSIKKAINIKPSYLLTQLGKSNLVKYISIVDDSDSTQALGFTFKGNQGIGEKKASAVSEAQKRLDPSSMGILDPSTSNKSDPGMSGMLCPYTQINEKGYFTDYEEPDVWNESFNNVVTNYREALGLKAAFTFKTKLGLEHQDDEYEQGINQHIASVHNILRNMKQAEDNSQLIMDAFIFTED